MLGNILVAQVLLSAGAESAASCGKSSAVHRPPQEQETGQNNAGPVAAAAAAVSSVHGAAAAVDAAASTASVPRPNSPRRSAYAAAILARGLHRRPWTLVVTGHRCVMASVPLRTSQDFSDGCPRSHSEPLYLRCACFADKQLTKGFVLQHGSRHRCAAVAEAEAALHVPRRVTPTP